MRARIIILSVYVFCCLSCTKKPLSGQLPVVSTTGSMTFGCILNGSTAYVVTDTLVYNGGGWNINCYTGIKAEFYAGTFNIFTYDCLANTYEFNMVIGGLLSGNGTY